MSLFLMATLSWDEEETRMEFKGAPFPVTWQGVARNLALAAPLVSAAQLGGGTGCPAGDDHVLRAGGALWLLLRLSFAAFISF